MPRTSLYVLALAIGVVSCQPKPQPIDQAALREQLRKSLMDPPSVVAERLRGRGFACTEGPIAWVKTGAAIGCSSANGANFLNVELAGTPSGARLGSYRIYETAQPLYGKAR